MPDTDSSRQKQFTKLQNKIKDSLADAIERSEISPKNLLLILEVLGKAENFEEMHRWVEIFADDFACLDDLVHEEKRIYKSDFENEVKSLVSELLRNDPLKAVEVSKIALEKEMTKEKFLQEFPEFKNKLNG